jgi:hypothetical protein
MMEADEHMEDMYVAKCANHSPYKSSRFVGLNLSDNDGDDDDESDEDNNSMIKSWPTNGIRCRCHDPKCKVKQYIRKRQRRLREKQRDQFLNDLDNPTTKGASNLDEVVIVNDEEAELIRLAGGQVLADQIMVQCEDLVRKDESKLVEPVTRQGDTILMQKCCRKRSLSETDFWRITYGQIWAFAKIMARLRPDVLAKRNTQVNEYNVFQRFL